LDVPGGDRTDPVLAAEGVMVRRTGSGAALLVPRAVSGLTGDAADVVAELQTFVLHRYEVEEAITTMVAEAREYGVSWSVIGWSVGTTAEAARQRWSESGTD
jgi:hypothetical protein